MDITQDFIDEGFRSYVLDNFSGGRGRIDRGDVEDILSLQIQNHKFSSLRGIEHFVSLEQLDCSYNLLRELDLSHNGLLKELNCNNNEIHELDLTHLPELEVLDCGFNRIRGLNVSDNPKLTKLHCYWNILSELKLDRNEQLKELNCGYNSLFALDLDQNKGLARLDCGNNYLSTLNIGNCQVLRELRCNHNHLAQLDVAPLIALESLRCFNNHIMSLDISQNAQLIELYCSENKLSMLDTSDNAKLVKVDSSNNLMIEPDYSIEDVGTFIYNNSFSSYSATLVYRDNELAASVGASTHADMEQLSPMIRGAWKRKDELIEQALELIARTHPDEDVNELVLSALEFDRDGAFRLGYDAGETPAGHLYIYALFSAALELDRTLVYETY
ncbi:leucine-rich repeat domain-containing protein [Paenibacillus sp. NPDC057967]|uniref:leucine-rich repeat domain-containing protein n=1 Tax=Paenibacillus sp. NPDC057967 TaxID=3346293 RepID=UPI0036DAF3BC